MGGLEFFEREISESFGIKFYYDEIIKKDYIQQDNLFYLAKNNINPIKRKKQTSSKQKNVEFIRVQVEGGKLLFEMFGGYIVNVEFEGHFQRMGIEKKLENIKFDDFEKYLGHINYKDWPYYGLMLAEINDRLKNKESSPYEKSKRMIIYELARVCENLDTLETVYRELNETYFYNLVINILKDFKNAMYLFDTQLPIPKIVKKSEEKISNQKEIKDYCLKICLGRLSEVKLLFKKTIRFSRLLKSINKERTLMDVLALGLTSLPLRSYGINYDSKKNDPFYFYNELDLNNSMGVYGGVYDSLLLRLNEVEESLNLLIRLVESLPSFEKINIEETKIENDCILFSYCDTARGELGMMQFFKKNEEKVYRTHILSPTLRVFKYYQLIVKNKNIEDALLEWSSLGLNLNEVKK